jgi:transposase
MNEAPKVEVVDLPAGETPAASTHSEVQPNGGRRKSTVNSIGIDLGKKPAVCIVAGASVVQRQTLQSIHEMRSVLGPEVMAPSKVAIEACREAWAVARWLKEWGHEVLLVDTTRVKQMGIGQHRRKTDRIDAETLARAVEENRVPRAHLLSDKRQKLRLELSSRRALVEARANFVTTVRGVCRTVGIQLPSCDIANFVTRVRQVTLPEEITLAINPLLEALEALEPQLARIEERLEKMCETEPSFELLKTAPGTGAVLSAAFISVIDDPNRFESAHQVEAYLGLVPSENTSGKRKLGSITKQGNTYLRALLVQGAWTVLRGRSGDPLTMWGQEVSARRGKRVGAIAVARRLAGILWAMWRRNTVYEPRQLAEKSAAGFNEQAQSALVRAHGFKRAAAKQLPTRRGAASSRKGEALPTSQQKGS